MTLLALFVILVVSVLVAALARRRGWNAPLIVLAVALAVAWIPGVGHIEVESEILLGVVLPPLLYSAALSSSYQDFRAAIKPILNLGVGHVLVTAFAVAGVVCLIMGNVPFAAAMVLGAVVAPPDAVAAAAVAKKLGLPRRITNVLTGESLINDATSLTLYKVALAGVAAVGANFGSALSTFALAVVGGIGVGVALGLVVHLIRRWLDDAVVETVIGLIVPFAGYWLAEAIHGSGVLGVVAAGFVVGRLAPRESYSTRLYEEPLWAAIDLVLECFTFALIGLQLPWVWRDIVHAPDHTAQAVWVALAVLATTLAMRPIYVFATRFLWTVKTPSPEGNRRVRLTTKDLMIVSWAGMRGVVTLAATAAIPVMAAGEAFPQRATLQLAAYTVAIGTLLIQGLSLPSIIRRLGVDNSDEAAEDAASEARVRRLTADVAAQTVRRASDKLSVAYGEKVAQGAIDQVLAGMARRGQAAATLMASPDAEGGANGDSGDAGDAGDEQEGGERSAGVLGAGGPRPRELGAGERAGELGAGERGAGERAAGERAAGERAAGDASARDQGSGEPGPGSRAGDPVESAGTPRSPVHPLPLPRRADPGAHPPAPWPPIISEFEPGYELTDPGHAVDESTAQAVRGLIDDLGERVRAVKERSGKEISPETADALEAKLRDRQDRWRAVLHQDQDDRISSSAPRRGWRRLLHARPDDAQFKQFQKQINALRRQIVRAQRAVIVQERNAGRLNETVMRVMMRELDLEEEALATSWATRL